jgi:hypothetical protein
MGEDSSALCLSWFALTVVKSAFEANGRRNGFELRPSNHYRVMKYKYSLLLGS